MCVFVLGLRFSRPAPRSTVPEKFQTRPGRLWQGPSLKESHWEEEAAPTPQCFVCKLKVCFLYRGGLPEASNSLSSNRKQQRHRHLMDRHHWNTMLRDVLSGCEHTHSMNAVHNDIKLSNIAADASAELKVSAVLAHKSCQTARKHPGPG